MFTSLGKRRDILFKRVVVAADGSDPSVRAARYAVELAEKFSSMIDIVHVVDLEKSRADVLHFGNKHELEKMRIDRLYEAEKIISDAGIDYEFHILEGEPGPTIINFTHEHDVDCIIMGKRGLNKFQTFLLGSVSDQVVKNANCPVLIIK